MRTIARVFAAFLLYSCITVAALAEPGLAIGLELDGDSVRQVSVSTVERVAAARKAAATWTLQASDAGGAALWSRPVVAPRQYHGDATRPLRFVLTLPQPALGTQLKLLDERDRVRWETRVERRLIDEANASRRSLDEEVRQARAASKSGDDAASAALSRQLQAGQARAEADAMQRNQPPRRPATSPAAASAQQPDMRTARHPILRPALAPTTPRVPVAGAKAMVAARIVLEDGSEPNVQFLGWLYGPDGSFLQQIEVPNSGRITLDLRGRGDYQLYLQPPPPFLEASITFTYTGAAPADFVLQRGWRVDLDALDAADGRRISETAVAWLVPSDNGTIATTGSSNGRFALAVRRDATISYTLYVTGFDNYPGVIQALGRISADAEFTLSVPRTPTIDVQARDAEGNAVTPLYVQCNSTTPVDGRQYFASDVSKPDGHLPLPLPRGPTYDCYVSPDYPFLTQWFSNVSLPASGPLVFTVQHSSVVRLLLQDEAGAPFTDTFQANWYDASLGVGGSCTSSPCSLRVPSGSDVAISLNFDDDHWRDFSIGPERFAQDTERTLTVQRLHDLEGSVRDATGTVDDAHILVYDQDGAFVDSIHTADGGRFKLSMSTGQYRLHAFAPLQNGGIAGSGDWLYRGPTISDAVAVNGDVDLTGLQLAEDYGELALRARLPCQPLGTGASATHPAVLRLTSAGGTHVQQTWRPDAASVSTPDANGECVATYIARLSPGTYSLAATPLGWPEKALGAVTIAADARRDVDAAFPLTGRSRLWQPTLSYANGTPAAGASIALFDEAQRFLYSTQADASGHANVPWNPGWGVELFLPPTAAKTALRRSFQFDATPPPAQLRFETVALTATSEADTIRLFGNGERERRYNILFVAEGYAGERETFTDTNGNGVWDGVLWHDIDHDDVYSPGSDWIALYGNAQWPVVGSVPDEDNEPFEDLNDDGALSLDDRALFIENAHSFMRSLLGSDFWAEHRDAFNAYAYFSPSPQAGYDIVDEDGVTVLLERDTLYGAGVELDRQLLLLDRDAAIQRGLNVLPEVDIVVTLINQPVSAGRANVSFGGSGPGAMIYYGGMQQTSPNGIVQSHEMGHFVGALCDEYSEFPGQHPSRGSAGPGCANASYRHRREHLPWKGFIAADTDLPTLDSDGAIGAYIGALYYRNGAFRPSENSTMRHNSAFFNAPSRAALNAATCLRTTGDAACEGAGEPALHTATWWDPSESGWGLFTIDQGNVIAPGWFTYDLDGEPTWFLVPGALPQADGSYRGDILRYTGVPFPQIAANGANPPTTVGSATLRFEGDDSLQFAYTIGGDTTTRTLSRFVYGNSDIVCRASTVPPEQATQYSDLWWSSASVGWGLLLSHIGDTLYATWYTYDLDGEAVFMVGAATRQADGSYSGGLVRQRDGTPYPQIDGAPPSPGADTVGTLTLHFDDGNHGTFSYTVGQNSGEHAITRLQFGNTTAACEAVPVAAE